MPKGKPAQGSSRGGPAPSGKNGGKGTGKSKDGPNPNQTRDVEYQEIKESKVSLGEESHKEILRLIARLMEVRGDAVPSGAKRGAKQKAGPAESLGILTPADLAILKELAEVEEDDEDQEEILDPRKKEDEKEDDDRDERNLEEEEREEDDEDETQISNRARRKEEERVQRRLMRQLISEDRDTARQSGEINKDVKVVKVKKKQAVIPQGATVRVRICEENKSSQKPKGPLLIPRGGEESLKDFLETAKSRLGIKSKKPLWAYVLCDKGEEPVQLTSTTTLPDDALVIISVKPAPGSQEAASQIPEAAAQSPEVAAQSPEAPQAKAGFDAKVSLDALRAAYRERAGNSAAARGTGQLGTAECKDISEALQRHASDYAREGRHQAMRDVRTALPASVVRAEFLAALKKNRVVVVAGETGSGKTTQCPNFILEAASEAGCGGDVSIVCTQPRRLAAVGVAERVAQERGEEPGGPVGYAVRLDSKATRRTRLLFCTTGVLLQRLNASNDLEGVTHVVVDEAHERNLQTDFLLVILRELMRRRKDLKLVLMSATLQEDLFVNYFAEFACSDAAAVPVIKIEGRTHPVTTRYMRELRAAVAGRNVVDQDPGYRGPAESSTSSSADAELEAWVRKTHGRGAAENTEALMSPLVQDKADYALIADLCATIMTGNYGPPGGAKAGFDDGAILIFLPGQVEIERCIGALRSHPGVGDRAWLLPLLGSMPVHEQRKVFQRPPDRKRKIVVATNIAETSITIDDATHVIDSGHLKEMRFDPRTSMSVFSTVWVSQAAGKQRAGRAGRTRPGVCWRLYEQPFESRLPKYSLCEMRRTSLEELVLQLRLLELGDDPAEFLQRAPEPPAREAVASAVRGLQAIGALGKTAELPLTPLGFHLSHMPVDARTGKMLIYGALCRCLGPILTIAACLSHKSPFVRNFNRHKEGEQQAARQTRFGELCSDQLAVVAAYDLYQGTKRNGGRDAAWWLCDELGLSSSALDAMEQLRAQFLRHLTETGFAVNSEGQDGGEAVNTHRRNLLLVRCVLCAGLFPNIAQVQKHSTSHGSRVNMVSRESERCSVHPSSLYCRQDFAANHGWLLYHAKVQTSQIYLHDSTLIGAIPILLFGGGDLQANKTRSRVLVEGIPFDLKQEENAVLFKMLRREVDRLLLLKVANPSADLAKTAEPLLDSITKLLQLEGDRSSAGKRQAHY